MSIQIRAGLRKLIPASLWPFFRRIDKYIIDALYIYFATRRFLARKTVRYIHPLCQSVPLVNSSVHFGSETTSDNLVHRFKIEKLNFKSGRHSVYIYRPEDITRIHPALLQWYPHPFGLKIIKSREMASDSTPYYTSRHLAPASSWFSMFAVGSMKDKMVISNLLASEEVAPRVYDLLKLESEDGGWQYALVVEHMDEGVVTGHDGIEFVERFTSALNTLGMQTLSIKEHCDLRPPDFRHNIVKGRFHTCYVDIQNFVMFHRAFLDEVFCKIEHLRTLDASPLLIDTLLEDSRRQQGDHDFIRENCKLLQHFLEQHGICIENLLLVDKSNGSGIFTMCCLHLGAKWCIMVREESRMEWFGSYMTLLGYSRFQVVSAIQDVKFLPDDEIHQRKLILFINADDLLSMAVDRFPQINCDYLIIETIKSVISDVSEFHLSQLQENFIAADSFSFRHQNETVLYWHLFFIKSKLEIKESCLKEF
jgi:hypothetical protein